MTTKKFEDIAFLCLRASYYLEESTVYVHEIVKITVWRALGLVLW